VLRSLFNHTVTEVVGDGVFRRFTGYQTT
jgi:hypothetical protein